MNTGEHTRGKKADKEHPYLMQRTYQSRTMSTGHGREYRQSKTVFRGPVTIPGPAKRDSIFLPDEVTYLFAVPGFSSSAA